MMLPFDQEKYEANKKQLREYFDRYRTSNLKGITPEDFADHIRSWLERTDHSLEEYQDYELDRQRDLSVKFHWGHNHDFGDFEVQGRMGDRHINVLANFLTLFPVSLQSFEGKDVFDIGCWTGGTTLLLAALGTKVLAIEEVKKYAQMVDFLAGAFGIEERVRVKPVSIYSCNSEEYYERFDVVYMPGVIYHLSDPVVGLRILYNALRVGGVVLVESAGMNSPKSLCRFLGSLRHKKGQKEDLDRAGWNWFVPSPSALAAMMQEAGFSQIEAVWHEGPRRVYAYGVKESRVGICKAGLSVPDIP